MHETNKSITRIETFICPLCGRGLPVKKFLQVVPSEPQMIIQQCMGRKGFKKVGKRSLGKHLLTVLKHRIRALYNALCLDDEPNSAAEPEVLLFPPIVTEVKLVD